MSLVGWLFEGLRDPERRAEVSSQGSGAGALVEAKPLPAKGQGCPVVSWWWLSAVAWQPAPATDGGVDGSAGGSSHLASRSLT